MPTDGFTFDPISVARMLNDVQICARTINEVTSTVTSIEHQVDNRGWEQRAGAVVAYLDDARRNLASGSMEIATIERDIQLRIMLAKLLASGTSLGGILAQLLVSGSSLDQDKDADQVSHPPDYPYTALNSYGEQFQVISDYWAIDSFGQYRPRVSLESIPQGAVVTEGDHDTGVHVYVINPSLGINTTNGELIDIADGKVHSPTVAADEVAEPFIESGHSMKDASEGSFEYGMLAGEGLMGIGIILKPLGSLMDQPLIDITPPSLDGRDVP
jgi:hypothetical protein